jgi:hypothetical protein
MKSIHAAAVSLTLIALLHGLPSGAHAGHAGSKPERVPGVAAAAQQRPVPQDISGKYDGRIFYSVASGDRYMMKGFVTLEIRGENATLTPKGPDGRPQPGVQPLKGKVKAEVIQPSGLHAGTVKFEGDDTIEIRWRKSGAWLKLLRAKTEANQKRVFRFCSNSVSLAQCKQEM